MSYVSQSDHPRSALCSFHFFCKRSSLFRIFLYFFFCFFMINTKQETCLFNMREECVLTDSRFFPFSYCFFVLIRIAVVFLQYSAKVRLNSFCFSGCRLKAEVPAFSYSDPSYASSTAFVLLRYIRDNDIPGHEAFVRFWPVFILCYDNTALINVSAKPWTSALCLSIKDISSCTVFISIIRHCSDTQSIVVMILWQFQHPCSVVLRPAATGTLYVAEYPKQRFFHILSGWVYPCTVSQVLNLV